MSTAKGLTAGVDFDKKKGITGSTLKIIAIIVMFIDHFAAIVLDRYLTAIGFYVQNGNMMTIDPTIENSMVIYIIDMFMRLIGRLGFPIFCFLMIEGFSHTRSKLKYLIRLVIFALISEVPFDLAFRMGADYQNVFFTLSIGLVVIWGVDATTKYIEWKIQGKSQTLRQLIVTVVIMLIGCVLAELLCTDYASTGIVTITVMYWMHRTKSKVIAIVSGCTILTISMPIEFTCFATVPLIAKYNGERGLKLKYIFYLFYPLHILLWYLVCLWMGI